MPYGRCIGHITISVKVALTKSKPAMSLSNVFGAVLSITYNLNLGNYLKESPNLIE